MNRFNSIQLRHHGLAVFAQIFIAAVAVIAIASFAIVSHSQTSSAEEGSADALRVSPVRNDITVEPGKSTTVKLQVSNLTDHTIKLNPVENDFIAGDEKGTPALILDETESAPTHSLKQFMKPLKQITLEPRKSATVPVEISVPKGTQAGGYFGAVQFTPSVPGSGGQVNLNTHVASLILLTVPGNLVEKLNVTDFKIDQSGKTPFYFTNGNNLQLTARFENKGNIQVGPFGDIAVRKSGNVVSRTSFNNERPADMTLPDTARVWEVPLDNITGFGKYEVLGTFSYGQNGQTIEASTTFWIIPRWVQYAALAALILVVAAIIVIPVLISRRSRRRRRF